MLVVSISLLTGEESLTVLVKSEVGDLAVGGVDGDLGLLSVHLLLDEFLNVDAPSATVDLSDLTFAVLVGSSDNLDGVTITDGDGTGLILLGELFAELGRHHSASQGRGCGEVSLSRLSALAGHVYINRESPLDKKGGFRDVYLLGEDFIF